MNPFQHSQAAENQYARQLRKIANEIGRIVSGFDFESQNLGTIINALALYAEIIRPWAFKQAEIMLNTIDTQNQAAWQAYVENFQPRRKRLPAATTPPQAPSGGGKPPGGYKPPLFAGHQYGKEIAKTLKQQLRETPVGQVHRELLGKNVNLITSLPVEAAERVIKLAHEGIAGSSRGAVLIKEIMRTGEVTKSRATLIARTETTRARTTFTMIRAVNVGSEYFKWNTAHDSVVRPSHRELDGKLFRWDDPPECDPGKHALPGCIWNCRCLALPILPDEPLLAGIGHNSQAAF